MRSRRHGLVVVVILASITALAVTSAGVTDKRGVEPPARLTGLAAVAPADSSLLQPRGRDPYQAQPDLAVSPIPPAPKTPRSIAPVGGSTPTPAPTPTPTPPPAMPWPGPGNTGVPAGTQLVASGTIIVTVAGTVIAARDVNGCIDVEANNVTIKRTRIGGDVYACSANNLHVGLGVTGLWIEDTEIDGHNLYPDFGAIGGAGAWTCLRCNIHNVGDGVHLASNIVIQDSYVHDIFATSTTHNQDILSNGPTISVTIRHNTLENAISQTGTIDLFPDFGVVQHVTIDHNLLNGGGWSIYGGSNATAYSSQTSYIVVTNNHFGRKFYPSCGHWGPDVYFNVNATGNVWSGNVWDDTGLPVAP